MMQKNIVGSFVLTAVVLLAACNGGKGTVCEAGRTVSCACGSGVEGTQTCLDDGSGWDLCRCPSPDADVDEDVAVDDLAAEDPTADEGGDVPDLDVEEDSVTGPCEPDDGTCAPPSACMGGGCVDPVDDPEAYAEAASSRPSSYWWMAQFPAAFDPPEDCCFDLTGDGTPDNAFGAILGLFESMPDVTGDPQELLDGAIEDGTWMRVVDWLELPGGGADGPVRFSVFEAASTQPFAERAAGSGVFQLLPSSFGDYGALDQFNWGHVTGGVVHAGPSSVGLPVTVVRAMVEVPVSEQSDGVHSVDETRPGDTPELVGGGRLGGVIPGETLLALLDDRLGACTCAGFEGLEFYPDTEEGTFVTGCTGDIDPTGCGSEDEPYCAIISTICSALPILPLTFDLDLDGDGINESLSIGMRFAWTGAAVDGLAPE